MIFLNTASILVSASTVLISGLILILITFVPFGPNKNTEGTGAAYGDLATMSLTTPSTVKRLNRLLYPAVHSTTSPTGFLKPNTFAAASLMTKPAESLARSLEKSRPLTNCHPTVFPYSGVTVKFANSTMKSGSFPSQLNPPLVFQISVVGLDDSAISVTAPLAFNSVCNTSYLPRKSGEVIWIISNPFLSYPAGRSLAN